MLYFLLGFLLFLVPFGKVTISEKLFYVRSAGGFGAEAVGGRFGTSSNNIYYVTSLEDSVSGCYCRR
jgi:hypothetical protein